MPPGNPLLIAEKLTREGCGRGELGREEAGARACAPEGLGVGMQGAERRSRALFLFLSITPSCLFLQCTPAGQKMRAGQPMIAAAACRQSKPVLRMHEERLTMQFSALM